MNSKNISSFNEFHKTNLEIYYQILFMSARKFIFFYSYNSNIISTNSQNKINYD